MRIAVRSYHTELMARPHLGDNSCSIHKKLISEACIIITEMNKNAFVRAALIVFSGPAHSLTSWPVISTEAQGYTGIVAPRRPAGIIPPAIPARIYQRIPSPSPDPGDP